MTILTSQDRSRTFKMDSIIGIATLGDMHLYVSLTNGGEYLIGKFSSEKKAKEVMEEIWYAIDDDVSYLVPQEANDDRIES